MNFNSTDNTTGWPYYYPLLVRYAGRIISDYSAASLLVKKVLSDQYIPDSLQHSEQLRNLLKTDVLHRCCCHIQIQVFDRPPVKIPLT